MGETFVPWLLFLLYVLAIVGLTWWNRRKAATMSAFAVGTRSLPPFLVGLSLAANMTSAAGWRRTGGWRPPSRPTSRRRCAR